MKLSDVCEFIVDCPHSTAPDEGAGYPLIRTPNIGRGRLNLNGVHRVSEKIYLQRTQRGIPQKNDLILAREAPAGNVAIIKNEGKVCLGQRTVLIRPLPDKANPDYLTYYLLSPQQQYNLLGTANGATVAHVNLSTIRNLKIQLPPINIQCHIVDILSAYDELIEVNQKQIRLLEEAARRLYREWFVDLRFPGHENTPITDGIPAGWTSLALSQIFDYTRGKSYSSEELSNTDGICLINLNNVNAWGGYKRGVEKRFTGTYSENHEVKSGDIIMAVTDMTQERRLVGHVALVPVLAEKALISMDLIKITPKEPVTHYFLYSMLRFSSIAEQISQYANGANVLHLRPENIARLKAYIPSKSIMMRFEKIVANYYAKIEPLEKQILLLQEARDRLLPKLMNGEIEV